ILNTGIGWHEARVPTIATSVPRGGWAWVTRKLMGQVGIPVITSNRINTPELAEELLAGGAADMVSMARPFLADPDFVAKAAAGRARDIAPCIACNQACLDHTFQGKISSCLVNPRACHETELRYTPSDSPKRIAVVGAGPAGLMAALVADQRGHSVTLYESDSRIGGQLNMARVIPGKEEFHGLVDWFQTMLDASRIAVHLNTRATPNMLAGFDEVILATGVLPRDPQIEGQNGPNVLRYIDVLRGQATVGARVVVVGAGGIGFDVAEYLAHDGPSAALNLDLWQREWGVTDPADAPGGLAPDGPQPTPPARQITLVQRKPGKPGKGLGKTTGWIHRASLAAKNVTMLGGMSYKRITADGLVVEREGAEHLLPADTIVLCTGQDPLRELVDSLPHAHVIGGADVAAELDAKRAIDQGARLAAKL
ncbi:MAG: FAD-dependent oxidoreductase, partial [Rhodobacteraceae bacterium]|nr:FAD-dependent oxidoreductase [Paracoccaceae bacterium]